MILKVFTYFCDDLFDSTTFARDARISIFFELSGPIALCGYTER